MRRHLTPEEITHWMAGEPTPEMERHVSECPQCRAGVAALDTAFTAFRQAGHDWSERCYAALPPFVPPAPARARRMPVWAGVMAAGVLAGAILLERPVPAPPPADEPFIQIPYVGPLAPYERTGVVRMDVPVAALIAAGFDVHVPDVGAAVQADVLFGQDGRAHAIRLVPGSLTNFR